MNTYAGLNTFFDEDGLPPGQKTIATTSFELFKLQADLLMKSKSKTGYSTMGVVTGLSGVGKTIATWDFIKNLAARSHTGLPACVSIKVKPGSTPRQLVEDLLLSLGERPRSLNTNRYKIADDAAEAILSNDLKALFIDNAEQLNTDGFEFLCYIFDKTGCSIIVVGLSQILRLITRHEKFAGRVGLCLDFLPPDENEVIQTVLPKLVIPRWTFDPSLEADLLLGQKLWTSVRPSLRTLRIVIQNASQLAELHNKERITGDLLNQSFQMTSIKKRKEELALEKETEEREDKPQTDYEVESEDRQTHKKKDES